MKSFQFIREWGEVILFVLVLITGVAFAISTQPLNRAADAINKSEALPALVELNETLSRIKKEEGR